MGSFQHLPFPQHFETLRQIADRLNLQVYLVGGAVRDLLLTRETHDLDFAIFGQTRSLARKFADASGGAFFMLNDEFDTARVILGAPERGEKLVVDFAAGRGQTITQDLEGRDFTINAIALDIQCPDTLIDPLRGAQDLRDHLIRACTPHSLQDDPLRVLRAVRMAFQLDAHIVPDTLKLMKKAVPLLRVPSPERRRDELFRILNGRHVSSAIRVLDHIGAVEMLMPELSGLKGLVQPPPHSQDAWEHTLSVLSSLESLFNVLVDEYHEADASSLSLGLAVMQLGRYRKQFDGEFNTLSDADRTRRALLFLAALLHDIAKSDTRTIDENGRIHFYNHENQGARTAGTIGAGLALSNVEIEFLTKVVRNHMRIHNLAKQENAPSRRAIYRFFKDAGDSGVGLCLLDLADIHSIYRSALPQDKWQKELAVCRILLETWYEKKEKVIAPPRLVSGTELIERFGLKPGPVIGTILESIREAQAAGEVTDRQQALALAEELLKQA